MPQKLNSQRAQRLGSGGHVVILKPGQAEDEIVERDDELFACGHYLTNSNTRATTMQVTSALLRLDCPCCIRNSERSRISTRFSMTSWRDCRGSVLRDL